MNRRQIFVILGALLLLAGVIFFARYLSSQKQPPPRRPALTNLRDVRVEPIEPAEVEAQIDVMGRLISQDVIEVYAEVTGIARAGSKSFREGNYFGKGQPLIRIDNQEQRLNLQAQRSNLANQITLLLPDLKLDYPESYPAWEQYVKAFDPARELAPLPEAQNENEQFFITARNLYQLYYNIKAQEERLTKYTIYAPFSGSVVESNIYEGTLVRAGQKLGEFANTRRYELEASVSVPELRFLKIGDRVQLEMPNSDKKVVGTIRRISDRIDESTQTVRLYVGVDDPALRAGMYLEGSIRGQNITGATRIPRKLLDEENRVFVVRDSMLQRVRVEPVKFGTRDVIVRGLPTDALLVQEGLTGVYENMKVAPYQR